VEIQWVLLAKKCLFNEDKTLDIEKITQKMEFDGIPYVGSLKIIIKSQSSPTEVGEKKTITLKIHHQSDGEVFTTDMPYEIPNLFVWAKYSPYITIDLSDFIFPKTGEYCLDFYIDGELKNSEWLTIVDKGRNK
jgi:hypothetical protein